MQHIPACQRLPPPSRLSCISDNDDAHRKQRKAATDVQPVLERLSQHKRSSARLISSCIYKCNLEYERSLAASASGRSDDDNAASNTNAESGTTTSREDTPAHASANHNADNGQSNPPIVSEDAPNLNIAMAAAAAPADGATLINPDKPADICNGQTT